LTTRIPVYAISLKAYDCLPPGIIPAHPHLAEFLEFDRGDVMSEPLLSIGNHHTPACGDPPIIRDDDPDVYHGYFENCYGEQWVFLYHRTTKKAELRATI
jgi:hypothetical protein